MSRKEDTDFNLALFASIAYFIWLDRNKQFFKKTKPLQPKQILNQDSPQSSPLLFQNHHKEQTKYA